MYTLLEILTFTHGMELKPELVIILIEADDRWHQQFDHVSNM